MDKKQEICMDLILEIMEDTYTLLPISKNENLDDHLNIIQKCIEEHDGNYLFEWVYHWFYDSKSYHVDAIMEELKTDLTKKGYKKWQAEKFFEEHYEEIETLIYERDDSDALREIFQNSRIIPIRIELISNFDCINSFYLESYEGYCYDESYFGDMVDALNLNPVKVKNILSKHNIETFGHFPNIRSRNGREHVNYEEFFTELENTSCGANLLTYMATADIQELFEHNFKFSQIIIPKGNSCGLFSSMYGGGSILEMKLQENVTVNLNSNRYPCYRITADHQEKTFNYSIKNTYDVALSTFGNTIRIIQ